MYDVVVIGGGSGGSTVALAAAREGARVAMIQKDRQGAPGGFAAILFSKALVRAGKAAHGARQAIRFGIKAGPVEVDGTAVLNHARQLVASRSIEESPDALERRGVDVYLGTAVFEAYDTVMLDGRTRIEGRRFVIATGSRPRMPEIPGLAGSGYLDSDALYTLKLLPADLLILGSDHHAVELGQALQRLGTKVTILEPKAHILPDEDADVASALQTALEREGMAFYTNVEITGVATKDSKTTVKFRRAGSNETFEASRGQLLVMMGRRANVEGLNLEAVGIHTTPETGISVDEHLQTSSRHVYAIGDVLGSVRSTFATEREATVAFQNATLGLSKRIDYSTIPHVAFTEPEVARIGPGEAELASSLSDLRVLKIGLDRADRSRIDGEPDGLVKILSNDAGRILGASIVAPDASLLIQELALAMDRGLTLSQLAETSHAYPTYASLIRDLAQEFRTARHQRGLMRTAMRWIYGFTIHPEATAPAQADSQVH